MATDKTITIKLEDESSSTVKVISIEPIESDRTSPEPLENAVIKQEKDSAIGSTKLNELGSISLMPNLPGVQYVVVTQPTTQQILPQETKGKVIASQPVIGQPKLIVPHQAVSSNGVLKLPDGTVIMGLPANLPSGTMVTYPQGQSLLTPQFIQSSQLQPLLIAGSPQIGPIGNITNGAVTQVSSPEKTKRVRAVKVKANTGAAKSGGPAATRFLTIKPLPSDVPAVEALNESSKEAYRKFRELVQDSRDAMQMGRSTTFHAKSRSENGGSPSSSRGSTSPQPVVIDNDDETNGDSNMMDDQGYSLYSTSSEGAKAALSAKRSRRREPSPSNKNDAYYERRRRNNFAAKRSRDARKQKEDEIAVRAAFLEQENVKLRIEVASLRAEVSRLHALLLAKGGSSVVNSASADNNGSNT